ncbi:MAG: patatin-like phospholipase family protein [Kineosporiaceae bacterium]
MSAVRWGVVLGAGGVLGGAWQVGALAALEERLGAAVADADVLLGTSVGALHAALVAAGVRVGDLVAHQEGRAPASGPLAGLDWDHDAAVRVSYPVRPWLRPGSVRLLGRALRSRGAVPRTLLLASLAPIGRGSLERVAELLDHVVPPAGRDGARWPDHPGLRVAAVDYDRGERIVLDRGAGIPVGPAVLASCSVPGVFPPVEVGDRRLVDGGVWSTTNADLLRAEGLAEVYVLAPLVRVPAARASARPGGAARVAWGLRGAFSRRTLREVARLREAGTRVTLLGPGEEDVAVMGADLMDPARRLDVLRTSRRTTTAALAGAASSGPAAEASSLRPPAPSGARR